jgi:hypothetical protein
VKRVGSAFNCVCWMRIGGLKCEPELARRWPEIYRLTGKAQVQGFAMTLKPGDFRQVHGLKATAIGE